MNEAGGVLVGTDTVMAMRRLKIDSIIIGLDEEFEETGADLVWKKPLPSNERMISQLRTAFEKREKR